MKQLVVSCLLAICTLPLGGCQSIRMPQFWPFPSAERTTYNTPKMRSDAISEFAGRSTETDSPEQREITDQLARQIQVEPDPLVRLAVVKTIAEFRTPMAQQVLQAGLADQEEMVRTACCEALGARGDDISVPSLAAALKSDSDIDVRLAAAKALGSMKSPEAVQALAVALEDRDPAMQYAGVQSMKSITGKDYGPDVATWRLVAAGQSPPEKTPSVAERVRGMSPFK